VTSVGDGGIRVKPFGEVVRLEFVRVIDYGITGLVTGPAPAPEMFGPPAPAPKPAAATGKAPR